MESLKRFFKGLLVWFLETTMGLLVILLILYGLVGTLDYQDQRISECFAKGLVWDSVTDTCKKESK